MAGWRWPPKRWNPIAPAAGEYIASTAAAIAVNVFLIDATGRSLESCRAIDHQQ
jgi:hypothetical protein